MTWSLKLGGLGSRGFPSHPSFSQHCTWTSIPPTRAPAQGSVIRQRLMQTDPPNGPHWQPLYPRDTRSIQQSRIEPLRGKAFHETFLALGLRSGWPNYKALGACLALPEVAW
jgi:hypothetical protein